MFRYLAFGDSMSIDAYPQMSDGVRGFPSLLVMNDDERFPDFRGRDLDAKCGAVEHVNFAVDGATSADVLAQQLPCAAAERAAGVDLITLTIGGNDLLATALAIVGVQPRPLESHVMSRFVDATVHFGVRLREILRALRMCSRRVLVGTIYDPTDGTGVFTNPVFQQGFSLILSPAETIRMLATWNAMIASTALDINAHLIDIHAHFLGHGDHHANPTNPHHDPAHPTGWLFNTVEPNGSGAHELRRLFWSTLFTAR